MRFEDIEEELCAKIEEKDKEIERLKEELKQAKEIALNEHKYASEIEDKYITANNIIKEQGIKDKPNYYVKGLEGSLKEYQEEVKRLNNIINELENIIDIEMNEMGYAKYDSCLILMKMKIKELKGSDEE